MAHLSLEEDVHSACLIMVLIVRHCVQRGPDNEIIRSIAIDVIDSQGIAEIGAHLFSRHVLVVDHVPSVEEDLFTDNNNNKRDYC